MTVGQVLVHAESAPLARRRGPGATSKWRAGSLADARPAMRHPTGRPVASAAGRTDARPFPHRNSSRAAGRGAPPGTPLGGTSEVQDTDRFVERMSRWPRSPPSRRPPRSASCIHHEALAIDLQSPLGSAFASARTPSWCGWSRAASAPRRGKQRWSRPTARRSPCSRRSRRLDGRVSLRLGTLVNTVLGLLDERGPPPPSAPTSVEVGLPVMDSADLERWRSAYQALDASGLWLPLPLAASSPPRRAGVATGPGGRPADAFRPRPRSRAAPGGGDRLVQSRRGPLPALRRPRPR